MRIGPENKWFIIEYSGENVDDLKGTLSKCEALGDNIRILGGNEFIKEQYKYEKLLGMKPIGTKIRSTDAKYKIVENSVISYE